MPFVRETSPNVFVEIDPAKVVMVHANGVPDVQWPGSIVSTWPADALATIGIYWVDPAVCPPGRKITGTRYQRVAGKVTQILDTASSPGALAPAMVAAAFNLEVADYGVSGLETTFNIAGLVYLDVGQYLAMLIDPLPDTNYSPLLLGEDGVLMRAIDRGVDYIMIDARNTAGEFADPPRFSLQIFRVG